MTDPIVAPYGTWRSPITARRVAAGVRPLGSPRTVGARCLWLQSLPEEGGCSVLFEHGAHGPRRLTPAPFNVRTRVHEYGGGAFAAAGDTVWFSHFADNLVYEQCGEAAPRPITADSRQRHADFETDPARARLIAVREDHGAPGEPRNTLVALPLAGGAAQTLAAGQDFYAAPRLSPEGRRLAWLSWDHPNMPWEGTQLWLAAIADDGALVHVRCVAGGPGESLCQPVWSPDGRLYVASDRSGWWNLYRLERSGLVPVCPMAMEFGRPMWQFAQSDYGFVSAGEIVASCRDQGRGRLFRIEVSSGHAQPLDTGDEDYPELRVGPGFVLLQAGAPTRPERILRLDLADLRMTELATSTEDVPDPAWISVPRPIEYPSAHGRSAHAFHYAPRNPDFVAPPTQQPPLIVIGHGGPTGVAASTLRLMVQFWTSRGIAVLDVNYGGSVGYGRAYRQRLSGQWGVVDVEDCVAGARHLALRGEADAQRLAIRGGSAGGFTTLAALAFHRVFQAGAVYYGVADLRALDADTHKFESHYNHDLLGPLETREALYQSRSPIHHADRIECPVIFFQGLDDRIVPPAQSESMVAALRARGVPVAYLAFEGEGHGFRRPETLERALESELAFFAQVFGFAPADAVTSVPLA